MSIKFLNRDKTLTQSQIGQLRTTRPFGYKYPVGLTVTGTNNVGVEYLIVAGGGGGGGNSDARYGAGGGGAGGYRIASGFEIASSQTFTVVVGAGGQSAPGGSASNGGKGSNTGFYTATTSVWSTGGGYGGGASQVGGSGGSGGGGGNNGVAGGSGNQGSYTPAEGTNGGNSPGLYNAGSGGGAGGAGGAGQANFGLGVVNSISGSPVTYSQGGKAWPPFTEAGPSNSGFGGDGSRDWPHPSFTPPAIGGDNYFAQRGGSGIVIIKYPGAQQATGGNVITATADSTVHVFTGSGFFNTSATFGAIGSVN